jgi:molybdopterin adenylyltransferase
VIRVSRGERIDESGSLIKELTRELGDVVVYEIIPDEKELIKKKLVEYSEKVDLILTHRWYRAFHQGM